jgi:glycosyltransferase involved in cell wall biosynthesis
MTETVFILENKLGGIASFCRNIVSQRVDRTWPHRAILLQNIADLTPRISEPIGVERSQLLEYDSTENMFAIFRRLRRLIGSDSGVLVSNSAIELQALSRFGSKKTIFQVVHDDFNFRLAQIFEPVVDVFIAHSVHFYDKLVLSLPHRASCIFHLPYGIPLADEHRVPNDNAIRLVFLGRLTEPKGALDLPCIDECLTSLGIPAKWRIIGDGPEGDRLKELMPPSDRVEYFSPSSGGAVMKLCADGDVLVFPTRFEGFPVALLEGMGAGLVPVVSDLPSGVPEVVDSSTGFRIRVGDIKGFVQAIEALNNDRGRLEQMSHAARLRTESFDIKKRAPAYHELFARAPDFKRPWGGPLPIKIGSRLDHPLLPNSAVRLLRSFKRAASIAPKQA